MSYLVKEVYKVLFKFFEGDTSLVHDIIWNKLVYLKTLLLALRLLYNRLPTKDNLMKCRIHLSNGKLYKVDMLWRKLYNIYSLNARSFGKVWRSILGWLGISSVMSNEPVVDHFILIICVCAEVKYVLENIIDHEDTLENG